MNSSLWAKSIGFEDISRHCECILECVKSPQNDSAALGTGSILIGYFKFWDLDCWNFGFYVRTFFVMVFYLLGRIFAKTIKFRINKAH